MTCTVILTDFEANRRTVAVLGEDDFASVKKFWEREDRLLHEMQDNAFFAGRRRWCDLDPAHYRLLILSAMNMMGELDDEQRQDPDNATMVSVYLMLSAMIHCLQDRCGATVELMRVSRLNRLEASFDYAASLTMQVAAPTPKPDLGLFRIVVDNE